ncbi:hypothetical protein PROFUN_07820 [Planoprotostelium fungivorum]|uniref:Uncharacterized protein n=1 Tax=Planoprotostelium fungivorum TaxID=1890364 RepID=A0A2P6MX75_9EUKA|nr:hypothetical protein PROFUN_07820 [Planoprotostelium fungivorum]
MRAALKHVSERDVYNLNAEFKGSVARGGRVPPKPMSTVVPVISEE